MNDHLTFAQLCNVLDDATVPTATLEHAQRCTRCSDRLASLRAQAAAMRLLAARQGIPASGLHRGSIMAAAREAGLDFLCRLLRELACACARHDPELAAQASRLQLARPLDRVAPDVLSMGRRLSGLGLVIELGDLPERPLSPTRARDATRHVLELLDRFQPPAKTQALRDALQPGPQPRPNRAARPSAYQPTAAPSLRDSLAPR